MHVEYRQSRFQSFKVKEFWRSKFHGARRSVIRCENVERCGGFLWLFSFQWYMFPSYLFLLFLVITSVPKLLTCMPPWEGKAFALNSASYAANRAMSSSPVPWKRSWGKAWPTPWKSMTIFWMKFRPKMKNEFQTKICGPIFDYL